MTHCLVSSPADFPALTSRFGRTLMILPEIATAYLTAFLPASSALRICGITAGPPSELRHNASCLS